MDYLSQKKWGFKLIICTCLSVLMLMTAAQVFAQDTAAQRIKQLENTLQEIQNELNRIKAESLQTTRKVNSS